MLTAVDFEPIIKRINDQATVAAQQSALLVRWLYEQLKVEKAMGVLRWYANKFGKFRRWIELSRWNAYAFLLACFIGTQMFVVTLSEFGQKYDMYFSLSVSLLYLIVIMPFVTITIIELLLWREDND